MRSLGSSPKVVGSVASEWHLGLGWVGVMVAFFRVTYYVNTYAYTHNVRNVRTVELRRTAANGSHAVRAIFAQITTCLRVVGLLLGYFWDLSMATIIANGAKGRALQLAPVHMVECVVAASELVRTVHMHAVDEGPPNLPYLRTAGSHQKVWMPH